MRYYNNKHTGNGNMTTENKRNLVSLRKTITGAVLEEILSAKNPDTYVYGDIAIIVLNDSITIVNTKNGKCGISRRNPDDKPNTALGLAIAWEKYCSYKNEMKSMYELGYSDGYNDCEEIIDDYDDDYDCYDDDDCDDCDDYYDDDCDDYDCDYDDWDDDEDDDCDGEEEVTSLSDERISILPLLAMIGFGGLHILEKEEVKNTEKTETTLGNVPDGTKVIVKSDTDGKEYEAVIRGRNHSEVILEVTIDNRKHLVMGRLDEKCRLC